MFYTCVFLMLSAVQQRNAPERGPSALLGPPPEDPIVAGLRTLAIVKARTQDTIDVCELTASLLSAHERVRYYRQMAEELRFELRVLEKKEYWLQDQLPQSPR